MAVNSCATRATSTLRTAARTAGSSGLSIAGRCSSNDASNQRRSMGARSAWTMADRPASSSST
eukprot:scaffold14091_cov28-Tisochrysis_lutea.AAC.11